MKVVFFTLTANMNTGSYRIWVHDLNKSLVENNIDSVIVYSDLNLVPDNADVVIFCKSAYRSIHEFKIKNNNTLIGAINVSCDYFDDNIDFVIAGSPEEYASLSHYKHVFIYPLVERKFENITRKVHLKDSETLKICFHGNYPHLFKFSPFLKHALETFNSNVRPIELHLITGKPNFKWETGKPDVKIVTHAYGKDFTDIVKSCDIGVVPNVSDVRITHADIAKTISTDHGLYSTDYFIRFKNKTNAGRAYVFYQHGIPVIHDLSPSSFELMKITGYNICAHNEAGWFKELCFLSDYKEREKVSKAYYDVFKINYNPHKIAKKLTDLIGDLVNG